jgi:hypothetical protein
VHVGHSAAQPRQTLGPISLFVSPYVPVEHGLTHVAFCKYPILVPLVLQTVQRLELVHSKHLEGHCVQLVLLFV